MNTNESNLVTTDVKYQTIGKKVFVALWINYILNKLNVLNKGPATCGGFVQYSLLILAMTVKCLVKK